MMGVAYERRFENDTRKGPKRKSPWMVDGDVRMGDTELILNRLEQSHGVRLDADLSRAERARSHAVRRMLEEHFHQAFECELALDDRGFAILKQLIFSDVPRPFAPIVAKMMRSAFSKHLFERGLGRHSVEDRTAMGKADVDALVELLGREPWFCGDRPSKVDASAFGLLAVAIRSGLPTPVCSHARAQPTLVAYVDRALAHWFPECVRASSAAA
jgi:glutathione S-transferase